MKTKQIVLLVVLLVLTAIVFAQVPKPHIAIGDTDVTHLYKAGDTVKLNITLSSNVNVSDITVVYHLAEKNEKANGSNDGFVISSVKPVAPAQYEVSGEVGHVLVGVYQIQLVKVGIGDEGDHSDYEPPADFDGTATSLQVVK